MEIRLQASGPVNGDGFMEALLRSVSDQDILAARVTVRDRAGGRAFNLGAPGEFGRCAGVLNDFQNGEIVISVPYALESRKDIIQKALMAVLNG